MQSLLAQLVGVDYSLVTVCNIGELSCSTGTIFEPLVQLIDVARRFIFPSVLFAMFVFYGFKLVVKSHDESAQTEARQAFNQAVFGTALVGGAFLIGSSFAIPDPSIVAEGGVNSVMLSVALTITALVFTGVIVNIFIQAYRLITAAEEGSIDTAKKRLIHGAIGGGIAILAISAVNAFFGVNVGLINSELVGIGNFLATIFGAMAVLGIFIAGIMLVVGVEESTKDRAKKLLLVSLVALVIVIAALSIIRYFAEIPVPTS